MSKTKASRSPRRKPQYVAPQEQQQTVHPDVWHPEVAYAVANTADGVADRLVGALVLIDHVMAPNPALPKDTGGYVIMAARDIIEQCQQDLRDAFAAKYSEEGGAR